MVCSLDINSAIKYVKGKVAQNNVGCLPWGQTLFLDLNP